MTVTYLGTTVLLFDNGSDQILFDCHVTRPSLLKFAFGKFQTSTEVAEHVIREFGIDRLRAIIVSHSHHDHVMDMPYFANKCGAEVYGSASTLNVARGGDVREDRLHEFVPDEPFEAGGCRITALKSIHSKPNLFNNDLGQTIDEPLRQPAGRKGFKEGGSYDFLVKCEGKTILIRPSYNYLPGQLDGIRADVLFLGTAGLSKDTAENRKRFYEETIGRVKPDLVVPVHWDNFFEPLFSPVRGMPALIEDTRLSLKMLRETCVSRGIRFKVMEPLSSLTL